MKKIIAILLLSVSSAFAGNIIVQSGAGTITGVTAGTGISGGGTTGNVTVTNTGVLSVSTTSVGGTPINGAAQLLPGSNITLTQSGQSITVAASGGGSAIPTGHVYCPPEIGCSIGVAFVQGYSSATLRCVGFYGGIAGSSSIGISSVTFASQTMSSMTAVGFYTDSGNLIAQSTTTPTNGNNAVINFSSPVTFTTGTHYFECMAADGVGNLYPSLADAGDSSNMDGSTVPSSQLNWFVAGNNSTVNSSGVVILPATLGTRTQFIGGQTFAGIIMR